MNQNPRNRTLYNQRNKESAAVMEKQQIDAESGLNMCQGFGVNHRNHFGIIKPVAALLTTRKN